jgi:hypothetical protein
MSVRNLNQFMSKYCKCENPILKALQYFWQDFYNLDMLEYRCRHLNANSSLF